MQFNGSDSLTLESLFLFQDLASSIKQNHSVGTNQKLGLKRGDIRTLLEVQDVKKMNEIGDELKDVCHTKIV